MNHNELFHFAGRCLSLENHPEFMEDVISAFEEEKVDYLNLVKLCSDHLILPALYLQLNKNNLMYLFPDDLASHIKDLYDLNCERNRQILQQIDEICAVLAKHGIEHLFMKGTGCLLSNVYADIGERMIGDIDMLVEEKNYLKTAELIMQLGYRNDRPLPVYYDFMTLMHYPRLYRTDVPADIEIHRLIVPNKYGKKFNSEIVFGNKQTIADRANCFAPSLTHLVIHNFIHNQLIHKCYRFKIRSLRDMFDIYRLSPAIDFQEVMEQVEEKKKACAYFYIIGLVFNTRFHCNQFGISNGQRYDAVLRFFWNHSRLHLFYIRLLKLHDLLFKRYLLMIMSLPFSKRNRQYVFNRLKNKQWYRIHFNGLRRYF
jgi:hypothetical protein